MTIVACPRCRDEVQLPARVSPQARVRCPLCRDEYILSEALAKMPPMLIVLDGGPALEEPGYAEPEYKVAGSSGGMMESGAMAGAFDSSPAVGESPVGTAPRPVKSGARPRKKSGGGALGQIIQVVLGGVGAFVLFQPLAWYVLKQDPFSMGPIVAKYAPGIVPEKYHGKSSSVTKNNGTGGLASNTNPPPVPASVKNKTGNFDPGDKFKVPENTPNPFTDPSLDLEPMPVIPPEPEMKLEPIKPMVDPPSKFDPPPPKEEDPNAPTPVSSTDINAAYGFAVLKREDFDAAGAEEPLVRQQKGKDFYEASAELGKLLADADLADPQVQDKLPLIKDEVGLKMANRLLMLAYLADPSLADDSKVDGIAIGGVIKDIKPLGGTHETTIEITKRDKTLFTLPIVTTKSLEDEGAKIGDTLIVLGKIIRDPKKDLPSYKGQAPQVIKAGHTTLVPAP